MEQIIEIQINKVNKYLEGQKSDYNNMGHGSMYIFKSLWNNSVLPYPTVVSVNFDKIIFIWVSPSMKFSDDILLWNGEYLTLSRLWSSIHRGTLLLEIKRKDFNQNIVQDFF